MTALILDGKQVSSAIKKEIKETVKKDCQQGYRAPGLAVVLVGNDPASAVYVNNKRKACEEVVFVSFAYNLSPKTSEHDLLALIDKLNESSEIDGILVQLPLPSHVKSSAVIERINPLKDVDGFHPYNLGRLAQNNPLLRPCTPYGVIQLLRHYQIQLEGLHAVVIGASNIVGRPMALEFLRSRATVTVCHRATKNLEQHVRMADILVVAAGVPDLIDTNWLHAKQIIIDVGIHRLENNKLRGDVNFHAAKEKTAWITPVPGGVGPMTISTLLQNTLLAAERLRT